MTLRAVKASDAAPMTPEPPTAPPRRKRAKTILEALNSGDRRALLVAQANRIARAVQDPKCSPRDLAALIPKLDGFQKQIEEFDAAAKAAQEVDDADDVDDEDFDPSTV